MNAVVAGLQTREGVEAVAVGGGLGDDGSGRGFTEPSQAGPFILMGISAAAYLVVRGLLFQARHQRRAMRQKRQMSNDLRRNL